MPDDPIDYRNRHYNSLHTSTMYNNVQILIDHKESASNIELIYW